MIEEQKTYLLTCDVCKTQMKIESTSLPKLPKNWKTVVVKTSFGTGYYDTSRDKFHVCETCEYPLKEGQQLVK